MLEEAMRKVFKTAEMTGKDIDQINWITDAGGFNTRQHLCLACIPLYTSFSYSFHAGGTHFLRNATIVNGE